MSTIIREMTDVGTFGSRLCRKLRHMGNYYIHRKIPHFDA